MTSIIAAMCIFSFTMSISPGPVNMTIVATAAEYGFRRTLPFVSGATIGFIFLLVILGMGLVQFVEAYPAFLQYLSVAGAGFIMYVGYKIASAAPEFSVADALCPSFIQGFLMQWLNPKAWLACIAGISLFTEKNSPANLVVFAGIYFVICYMSLSSWAVLGLKAKVLLKKRSHIRAFNVFMGFSLCACAALLLLNSLRAES